MSSPTLPGQRFVARLTDFGPVVVEIQIDLAWEIGGLKRFKLFKRICCSHLHLSHSLVCLLHPYGEKKICGLTQPITWMIFKLWNFRQQFLKHLNTANFCFENHHLLWGKPSNVPFFGQATSSHWCPNAPNAAPVRDPGLSKLLTGNFFLKLEPCFAAQIRFSFVPVDHTLRWKRTFDELCCSHQFSLTRLSSSGA